jgi:TRAP-type C4-dicarboxylate transport system permease small subunit
MLKLYDKALTVFVYALTVVSGVSTLLVIAITCLDIILRRCGSSIHGAVDIVKILGCLAVVTALPYTTAVKGHIAVEFLFRKLPRFWKIFFDTVTRLLALVLFSILCWRSFMVGCRYHHLGTASLTLSIPLCWLLWAMSLAFFAVILVKLWNLTHPGKEMIRL